jgi:hypothetical protein
MARKSKEKTSGAAVNIICIFTAAVMISGIFTIGAMNLFCTDSLYTDYSVAFTRGSVISGVVALAVTGAVIALLYNALRLKNMTVVMLGAAFAARLAAALFWRIEPESDFLITYDLGKLLASTPVMQWGAALDGYGTSYNTIWSAHMPFIVYQSLLLRITENAVVLRIANALFSWGSCFLTVSIAEKAGGEKARRASLVFMALNPVIVFFVPVLTNQHAAQFFFVTAIWIFYCPKIKNTYIRAWLSGACIGISHLLRPEMQVVAIALTICVLYSVFKSGDAAKKLTLYAVGLSALLAVIVAANAFLVSVHAVHQSIWSGNINYKILVGLNPETNGSWSAADSALEGNDKAINTLIIERLKHPLKLLPMMYGKASYQLGTYVYTWSFRQDMMWVSQNVMRRGGAALMAVVCGAAAWNMIRCRRSGMLVIYMILFMYALTYAVIEVQGRYNFVFIPLMVVGACASARPNENFVFVQWE